MSSRSFFVAAIAVSVVVPALAFAEVGPHSTWYAVHKNPKPTESNINIVYQRDKGIADINGINTCLGTSTPSGSKTKYANSFDAYPVKVKNDKIAFNGKVNVYDATGRTRKQMKFSATLKPKKAVGEASFPGTKCGTISFTAPLALYRK